MKLMTQPPLTRCTVERITRVRVGGQQPGELAQRLLGADLPEAPVQVNVTVIRDARTLEDDRFVATPFCAESRKPDPASSLARC
jgi:hypothetical protein